MPSWTLCVPEGPAGPDRTTRSVAEGIPTEDRGNEGFAVSRFADLWVMHSAERGNE